MGKFFRTRQLFGLGLFALSTLLFEYFLATRRIKELLRLYLSERKGRTKIEREIKAISNEKEAKSLGFYIQPIGFIESCYKNCLGTPRQGLLVPNSRATLRIQRSISPESLAELDSFSHIWITFKFHLNTNTVKESKAFSNGNTFNAKIALPVLKGDALKKVGVFASRSPHRPNPIGVTLAEIRSIDKQKLAIYINACDLLDGTPVYDVKPYVPSYDTVANYRIPYWIAETINNRNKVSFAADFRSQVTALQTHLYQYKDDALSYMQGLRDTLEVFLRSKVQTSKFIADANATRAAVRIIFDRTTVQFLWLSTEDIEVQAVELNSTNILMDRIEDIMEDTL